MEFPRHLWAGDWERESAGPPPEPPPAERPPQPPPPPPSRSRRRLVIGAGTVAALALVAIVAGVLAASGGTPRRPRAQLLFAPGTGGGGSPGMGAPPLQGTSPGLGSGTPQAGGPWLGISLTTSAAGGATVAEVEPGGPADQAGIQQGDVITQLGRNAVHSPSDVTQALASLQVGQQVLVQVQRDGQPVSDVVTLGSRPAGIP